MVGGGGVDKRSNGVAGLVGGGADKHIVGNGYGGARYVGLVYTGLVGCTFENNRLSGGDDAARYKLLGVGFIQSARCSGFGDVFYHKRLVARGHLEVFVGKVKRGVTRGADFYLLVILSFVHIPTCSSFVGGGAVDGRIEAVGGIEGISIMSWRTGVICCLLI